MSNADVLVLAVARYLCRRPLVDLHQLADDLMKERRVRDAIGLSHVPRADTAEWLKGLNAVVKAVVELIRHGLATYIKETYMVRWEGGECL